MNLTHYLQKVYKFEFCCSVTKRIEGLINPGWCDTLKRELRAVILVITSHSFIIGHVSGRVMCHILCVLSSLIISFACQ